MGADRIWVCPVEFQHPVPDFRFQARAEVKQEPYKRAAVRSVASPCGALEERAAP